MLEAGKHYRATARLGVATTTGDVEGEVIQTCSLPDIDPSSVNQSLQSFIGEIEQVPPMYSALKHEGKPLYEYARAGITIERPARKVFIHHLEMLDWKSPHLTFDVHCSKGTYIRTLAEDIAAALGSCAHLIELRRTIVEPFDQFPMLTLEQLQDARENGELQRCLLPVDAGLPDWPRINLDSAQRDKFNHGNHVFIPPCESEPAKVRVYGPEEDLLGLAELGPDGKLQPIRVFNLQVDPENQV